MALVPGDHRLTLFSTIRNTVKAVNVFYFKEAGGASNPSALAIRFHVMIVPLIQAVLSSDTVLDRIYVQDIGGSPAIYDTPINDPGLRSNAGMPNFVGYYFRYFRPNAEVDNGRKTFSVPAESDVADGIASGTIVPLLQNLATALQSPVTEPPFYSFLPCIAKTTLIVNPTPPPALRRVPITLYPVDNVQYVSVSTQNSRKR